MSSPASIRKDSKDNNANNSPNKPPDLDLLSILYRNQSPTLPQLTAHVKSLAEYVKDLSAYIAAEANTAPTPSNSAPTTPSKPSETNASTNESTTTTIPDPNTNEDPNDIMLALAPVLNAQLSTLNTVEETTNDCFKLCTELVVGVSKAMQANCQSFTLKLEGMEREVQGVKKGLMEIAMKLGAGAVKGMVKLETEARKAEEAAVPLRTLVGAAGPSRGKKGKGKGRRR
ncbi:hypothetical protein BDY17DRAFT_160182 [Neohortaea acidophila]|uniref:Uncharacterized protein n=1 Tax=Neohortaea acidophila TaxID=245834 RepID=A0A6A6PRQ4_9PEZI|nr:uncharacterized protein BDY17DRAFT_160182 [Neohortaea acidophila]KAF2482446.1 hypothetical protein BDY17DRAFT_160182 [Neohortaea acidophila]